ncbi:hypothetical protein ACHAWF_012071 [Thalassiosira exigua]
MVQSPFRYKKPSGRAPFLANGPSDSREQRPTVRIGGDAPAVAEGSVSAAVRGAWNLGGGWSKSWRRSSAESEVDSGESPIRGDDGVGSESGSSLEAEGDDYDVDRGPGSDGDCRSTSTLPLAMTSLLPGKEGSDVPYDAPLQSNSSIGHYRNKKKRMTSLEGLVPVSPPGMEKGQSVRIGGRVIIGEASEPIASSFRPRSGVRSITSQGLRSHGAPNLRSLDSEPTPDFDDIDSEGEADLEAANDSAYPYCHEEDESKLPSGTKRKSASARNAPHQESNGTHPAHHIHKTYHGHHNMKRRRLSKRARTRLTMREVNSNIQPGRHYHSNESLAGHCFEKRTAITIPKVVDFFRRIEIGLIAFNALVSALLTALVLYVCPGPWQARLNESSRAVSVLGAFLSFALVFRTQACYSRWWEARTCWGRITSAIVHLSGQAMCWFDEGDEDEMADRFLTQCVVFPYACKAVLRGNQLADVAEEGPRFLRSGMLTDAELGAIVRHGRPPFACLEVMRRALRGALTGKSHLQTRSDEAVILAVEQALWELYLNFGACLKIHSTRMPASYAVFMRSFVIFFFMLASLSWSPTMGWLTPVVTGFMVFLINQLIVIGDQMMHPFDLQWAGLPLQKFCVVIEHEVMNLSRRHADIEGLFEAW